MLFARLYLSVFDILHITFHERLVPRRARRVRRERQEISAQNG